MAANPMASRSAALAGAAQALNKPKQNLAGATGGTIQGAHGGTQQLGAAALRRVQAASPQIRMPGGPMPPDKPDPGTAAGMSKPFALPGFQPGQAPPIFAGGQQPGQPPMNHQMPSIDMPTRGGGIVGGIPSGPGGGMDQMHGAAPDIQGQMMAAQQQIKMPGAGQVSMAPGGAPFTGGPGDKPGGPLPGFMAAADQKPMAYLPGLTGSPGGGPDGGIVNMPGGPGQISLHGSPGGMSPGIPPTGLPTKPLAMPGNTDVWSRIAGGGFGAKRDPMASIGPGRNGEQMDY